MKDQCWIDRLSLTQQEAERREGFRSSILLARDLLTRAYGSDLKKKRCQHIIEHGLLELHDSICMLAHLNGYLDCDGNWVEEDCL
jgi:hypothetical protein